MGKSILNNDILKFDVATAAVKGGRDYQEDSLIASFPLGQETGFAVLADGMGGHLCGDVASALVMSEAFTKIKVNEMKLEGDTFDIPAMLSDVATAANDRLKQHIAEDPETYGMGSTLLATVIRGNDLFWVSVGDSPLFLFRDGALRQLNKDHSMAPQIDMMVKIGAMTEEAGRTHPDRNTLTSAISGVDIDKIDCPDTPTALLPGDIIIVASDGLQFLTNDLIAKTLKDTTTKRSVDMTDALLQALTDLDDPNQDNAAFTVIKFKDSSYEVATADADESNLFARTDAPVAKRPLLTPAPRRVQQPLVAQAGQQTAAALSTVELAPEPDLTPASDERRIVRLVKSRDHSITADPAPTMEETPAAKPTVAKAEEEVVVTKKVMPETPEPEAAETRQEYWYRGQKYFKD